MPAPPDPSPIAGSAAPRVDGHLDLAHNAVALGRDLTLDLDALRDAERRPYETAMVTFPELRRAGIDLVFATLFANPAERVPMQPGERTRPPAHPPAPGYVDAEGAHRQAREQLDYYRWMEEAGWVRLIQDAEGLAALARDRRSDPEASPIGLVLLMEGADPIRTPDEIAWWWDQGLRLLGPAWQRTRYAGGTRAPGGLTDLGVALIEAMASLGMALDLSHLAEAALWEALERFPGKVVATHSNARALTPTDRHLGDDAILAIGDRGGVVGIVLGNAFLDRGAHLAGREVRLDAVARQAGHVAGLIGWDRVGIGSDFDGGLGREETPTELTRAADWERLGAAAPAAHAGDLLGGAWWRWLESALPGSPATTPRVAGG
jgi:membrane dipeptidase